VAKATDVPQEHGKLAAKVPADVLSRLSSAELRARCVLAAEHARTAENAQAEHARYLHAHALAVLRSLPVVEFIAEKRRLAQQALGVRDLELRQAYRRQEQDLKEGNAYPSGLQAAVDDALLGNRVNDPALAALAAEIVLARG
jgi:hypothetical protein